MVSIRSYFRSFAGQLPLTPYKVTCNEAMKKYCQAIEWSYGDLSKYLLICAHPKHKMLVKKNQYAIEQLRVAHSYVIFTLVLMERQSLDIMDSVVRNPN